MEQPLELYSSYLSSEFFVILVVPGSQKPTERCFSPVVFKQVQL